MSEEEAAPAQRETFGHLIDITLDKDALDAKKNRLVAVDKEIDSISAKKAAAVADFNKELKDKRKERTTLLDTISSGAAKLELQCYNERDDRRGMMITRRVDTGEIVDQRALTAEERGQAPDDRQGNLFETKADGAIPPDADEPEEERGDEDTEKALEQYAAQSAAAGESTTSTAGGDDAGEDDDDPDLDDAGDDDSEGAPAH